MNALNEDGMFAILVKKLMSSCMHRKLAWIVFVVQKRVDFVVELALQTATIIC